MEESKLGRLWSSKNRTPGNTYCRYSEALFYIPGYHNSDFIEFINIMQKNYNNSNFGKEKDQTALNYCLKLLDQIKDNYTIDASVRLKFISLTTKIFIDSNNLSIKTPSTITNNLDLTVEIIFSQLNGLKAKHNQSVVMDFLRLKILQLENLPHCVSYIQDKIKHIVAHYEVTSQFYLPFVKADTTFINKYCLKIITSFLSLALRTKTVYKLSFLLLAMQYCLVISKSTSELLEKINKDGLKMMEKSSEVVYKYTAKQLYNCCKTAELHKIDLTPLEGLLYKYYEQEKLHPVPLAWENFKIFKSSTLLSTTIKPLKRMTLSKDLIDSMENMNISENLLNLLDSTPPITLLNTPQFIEKLKTVTKNIDINDSTRHHVLNRIIDFLAGNVSKSTGLFSIFDILTFKFKDINIVEENIFFVQNSLPLMSSILLSLQQNRRLKNFAKLFFYFGNNSIGLIPESSFQFWYNYIQCETVLSNTIENQQSIQKKFNYISTNELSKNNFEGIIAINCAFLTAFIYSELKPIGCENILVEEMNSNVKFIAKCVILEPQYVNFLFRCLENETLIVVLALRIIEMIGESEIPKSEHIISQIILIQKEKLKDTGLFLYFLSKLSFIVNFPINFKNNTLRFNSDSKIKDLENLVISHLYILQAISSPTDSSDVVLKSNYLICNYLKTCDNTQFSNYEQNVVETIFKTMRYHELFKHCSVLINQYIEKRRSALSKSLFETTMSYWLDINFQLEDYSMCDNILSNYTSTPSTYSSMKLLLSVLEYQIAIESPDSERCITSLYHSFRSSTFSIDKQPDKYKAIGLLLLHHKFCKLVGKYFSSKDMVISITNLNRSIGILQSVFKNFLLPGPSSPSLNMNFKSILKMEFSNEMLDCYSLILNQYSIIGFGKEFDHYLNELELFIKIQPSLNLNYNYGLKLIEFNLLRGDVDKASIYEKKVKEIKSQIFIDNNIIGEIYSLLVFENFSRISNYSKNGNASGDTQILTKQLDNLIFNLVNSTEIDPRVSTSIIQKWVNSMMRRYLFINQNSFDDVKLEIHPSMKNITEYHNQMKSIKDLNHSNKSFFYPPCNSEDYKLDTQKPHLENLFVRLVKTFVDSCTKFSNEITTYNLDILNTYFNYVLKDYNDSSVLSKYKELILLNDEYKMLPFKHEKIFSKNNNPKNKLLPEIASESAPSFITEKHVLRNVLPPNWIVVTIDYITSTNSIMITRHDMSQLPLYLNISLDGKDEKFGFQNCINRLKDIIEKSDKTTMVEVTSIIKTHEQKIEWWDTRKRLDKQLEQLLADIEDKWFGGLTTLLYEAKIPVKLVKKIKAEISYYFGPYIQKNCKDVDGPKLESIFECIDSRFYTALLKTSTLTDKMVSDTLKFIYEYSFEQTLSFESEELLLLIKSIRISLENLKDTCEQQQNSHIVLIPSSKCAKIPWESIPSLRKQSVTRMPTLQQLEESLKKYKYLLDNGISSKKGYYVINPGKDLKRTEENLGPRFTNLEGWNGIIGRAPDEQEIIEGISKADLYIYAGHGGGEQYIKSKNIKSRIYTPPTLLLGCSSGALKGNGSMHLYGTPYNYINGGCPMVLVNLWDVTDKDIDMFTVDALTKWGFFVNYDSIDPFDVQLDNDENLDLAQCIAKSRDICKLKYLNGAAPIIYGLPLKLESM